jgi:hypothetical protein
MSIRACSWCILVGFVVSGCSTTSVPQNESGGATGTESHPKSGAAGMAVDSRGGASYAAAGSTMTGIGGSAGQAPIAGGTSSSLASAGAAGSNGAATAGTIGLGSGGSAASAGHAAIGGDPTASAGSNASVGGFATSAGRAATGGSSLASAGHSTTSGGSAAVAGTSATPGGTHSAAGATNSAGGSTTVTAGGSATVAGSSSVTQGGSAAVAGSSSVTPGGSSITGVLYAPSGGDVLGTEVAACVANATTDCDPTASYAVTIDVSGSSAPFNFDGLPPGSYTLIALKDSNANGTFDAGDFIGAYMDASNNVLPVSPPASGITIRMVVEPAAQAATPSELVGTWMWVTSYGGGWYSIHADGTYDRGYLYSNSGSCITIDRLETTSSGALAVQGNQITFAPTTGVSVTTDCGGTVTSKAASLQPSTYGWRITNNADASTSLFLIDASSTEIEYKKQ